MNCRIESHDIISYFKKYKYVIPVASAELLVNFLQHDRYHNIIYEFEIISMHIIIKIFEDRGCYEKCEILKRAIEKHNKLTGKKYKTTL